MKMLDLEKIRAKWLNLCASCDAGMAMSCTCPTDDPRNIISTLVDHLEDLYANHELLSCSTMGEAFDRMEQTLVELFTARREAEQAQAGLRQCREHLVTVPHRHMDDLRVWLAQPNGSHSINRVTLEAVEGGGILVRTSPYATPAAAPKADEREALITSRFPRVPGNDVHDLTLPVAAPDPADDLDTHLAEQMADPAFAAAYRARQAAGAGDGEQDVTTDLYWATEGMACVVEQGRHRMSAVVDRVTPTRVFAEVTNYIDGPFAGQRVVSDPEFVYRREDARPLGRRSRGSHLLKSTAAAAPDADSGETDPCEDICHPAYGACCGGKRLRKLT